MPSQNTLIPEDIIYDDLQVSFSPSKRKTVKKIFVSISGNFTVKHIEKISDVMQLLINEYDQVALRLHDLQQIDLTAVQLLYNCLKKGDRITLDVDLPPVVRQLFSMTGLSEMFQKPVPNLPG